MWKILSLYWWLELVLGLQVVGGELQAGIGILWVFKKSAGKPSVL
jgi:hypothetical protein